MVTIEPIEEKTIERMSISTGVGVQRSQVFPISTIEIDRLVEDGDREFEMCNYTEAERYYRKAHKVSLKSGNKFLQSVCSFLLGNTIALQDRTEEALLFFEEAIRLKPDFAEAWYNRGVTLLDLERNGEALCSFEEATRHKPDLAKAWYNRGVTLLRLKQYEKALSSFEEALRFKPDNALAWVGKGFALLSLGRYKEALPCFDKGVELEPENAWAWHGKGAVLLKLERRGKALFSFERALKLNPEDAVAWGGRGGALFMLKRVEEAKKSFEKALSLREKLPNKGEKAFTSLASLILLQGLESISSKDMTKAEERALELIKLRKETEQDDMAQVVGKAVAEFKAKLSKKALKLVDEFEVMLTLLSIEDPLERWKALGKKISEKWPKGLSAVEAIRKERK